MWRYLRSKVKSDSLKDKLKAVRRLLSWTKNRVVHDSSGSVVPKGWWFESRSIPLFVVVFLCKTLHPLASHEYE